jgi:hypothetical protein
MVRVARAVGQDSGLTDDSDDEEQDCVRFGITHGISIRQSESAADQVPAAPRPTVPAERVTRASARCSASHARHGAHVQTGRSKITCGQKVGTTGPDGPGPQAALGDIGGCLTCEDSEPTGVQDRPRVSADVACYRGS